MGCLMLIYIQTIDNKLSVLNLNRIRWQYLFVMYSVGCILIVNNRVANFV